MYLLCYANADQHHVIAIMIVAATLANDYQQYYFRLEYFTFYTYVAHIICVSFFDFAASIVLQFIDAL